MSPTRALPPVSTTRVLPHNVEAERALLGALVRDNALLDEVAEIVRPEDFYRLSHQKLFAAALEIAQTKRDGINIITLAEYLKNSGDLEAVGGVDYVLDLDDAVPTAANAAYWADIVRELSQVRAVIQAAGEISSAAYSGVVDTGAFLAESAERFQAIACDQRELLAGENPGAAALSLFSSYSEGQREVPGLLTGIGPLDAHGGLPRGTLTLVGGRPKNGKSLLARSIARYVAAEIGPVLYHSAEMNPAEIGQAMSLEAAGLDPYLLRIGRLTATDVATAAQESQAILQTPIRVVRKFPFTAEATARRSRAFAAKHGKVALIIIDYVQAFGSEGHHHGQNRNDELSRMVECWIGLAALMDSSVLLLSQFSRPLKTLESWKEVPEPTMYDYRESGSLEQGAHNALCVHRPYYGIANATREQQHIVRIVEFASRSGGEPWKEEMDYDVRKGGYIYAGTQSRNLF